MRGLTTSHTYQLIRRPASSLIVPRARRDQPCEATRSCRDVAHPRLLAVDRHQLPRGSHPPRPASLVRDMAVARLLHLAPLEYVVRNSAKRCRKVGAGIECLEHLRRG